MGGVDVIECGKPHAQTFSQTTTPPFTGTYQRSPAIHKNAAPARGHRPPQRYFTRTQPGGATGVGTMVPPPATRMHARHAPLWFHETMRIEDVETGSGCKDGGQLRARLGQLLVLILWTRAALFDQPSRNTIYLLYRSLTS